MAIVLKTCLRACYDPHSKYLEDHYVLGDTLGKGAFGEVPLEIGKINEIWQNLQNSCKILQIFGGLVPGYIEADFCK